MTWLESINGGTPLQGGDYAAITLQSVMLAGSLMLAWRDLTKGHDEPD